MFALSLGCKAGPNLSADYAQTARENYEIAVGEFSDKDWEESILYADFVRIRFPFSRYSVEAELLIARAEFEQANYLSAQDAFHRFAKLHPTHPHVRNGWASFMAAASAYMNAPSPRVLLLPASAQLDQSPLQDALEELESYFDQYTGSITEGYAKKLQELILARMLDHELYVARFYLERERPEAAIGRLEAAQARFSGVGRNAEVLFMLGLTYLRMEEVELARSSFSELHTKHPAHHHGKQARIYLEHIRKEYGPADPARPRPDRSPPVPKAPDRPKNPARPERPDQVAQQGPVQAPAPPASASGTGGTPGAGATRGAPPAKPEKAGGASSEAPENEASENTPAPATTPASESPVTPEAGTPDPTTIPPQASTGTSAASAPPPPP